MPRPTASKGEFLRSLKIADEDEKNKYPKFDACKEANARYLIEGGTPYATDVKRGISYASANGGLLVGIFGHDDDPSYALPERVNGFKEIAIVLSISLYDMPISPI